VSFTLFDPPKDCTLWDLLVEPFVNRSSDMPPSAFASGPVLSKNTPKVRRGIEIT
jgi:hypothetical protein